MSAQAFQVRMRFVDKSSTTDGVNVMVCPWCGAQVDTRVGKYTDGEFTTCGACDNTVHIELEARVTIRASRVTDH